MPLLKIIPLVCLAGLVSACDSAGSLTGAGSDKTVDRGFDRKPLSELQAGIWIDPNGCDHWIIDDGLEGYLSARLGRDGKPICSGVGEPTEIVGDFKGGSQVSDPL